MADAANNKKKPKPKVTAKTAKSASPRASTSVPKSAPPFVANPDGTHCVQCVLQMALAHFGAEPVPSLLALARQTHKHPGGGTWFSSACLYLHDIGFELEIISAMDIEAFSVDAQSYLDRHAGDDATFYRENFDLQAAAQAARRLVRLPGITRQQKVPTVKNIRDLLARGYLVWIYVNEFALEGREGLYPHAILAYDVTKGKGAGKIIAHNPGVESYPAQELSDRILLRAMRSPQADSAMLIGMKLPN